MHLKDQERLGCLCACVYVNGHLNTGHSSVGFNRQECSWPDWRPFTHSRESRDWQTVGEQGAERGDELQVVRRADLDGGLDGAL